MANRVRILSDNIADRGTVSAGSAAITADYLKTDEKTEAWRSAATVTSTNVSVSWTTAESVSMVAFPFCNFSPTATIIVQLYSDTAGTVLVYTSPSTLCSPSAATKVAGLTMAQSSSAYNYLGGTSAVVYFPLRTDVKKVVINIVDTSNLQGYLEAARLVVGAYYTPVYDAEMGASININDTTTTMRSDAGSLKRDMGTKSKGITFDLSTMQASDRLNIWRIVSYCGVSYPVWISLYPENTDKNLEHAYTVFGCFSKMSGISAKAVGVFGTSLEIEGV